jgi:hypothetical protein
MGYGNYSQEAHAAIVTARKARPAEQVFRQQDCHPLMNPKGVRARESRDSAEHPDSTGIVFALDVTGSMGVIPKLLATSELPKFMKVLSSSGIKDPQLLFMAVGDATTDSAPLQVGQFESTAELMDEWLTRTFIEGHGGGNEHESYELALYFLSQHTEIDGWVKRKKRTYLFMTGDELPYETLSKHVVEGFIGDRLDDDLKTEEIVAELQNGFDPYFLIPDQGRKAQCESRWRELLGDNVVCMDHPKDTCFVAAGIILLREGIVTSLKEALLALGNAGLDPHREAPVARALAPFAPDANKHTSWINRLINVVKS